MTKEEIINPKRYTQNKLQCWDFWIKAGLDPLIASAVKYVWRYKYKNGIEDLKKAKVFINKAIDTFNDSDDISFSHKVYKLEKSEVETFDSEQFIFMNCASYSTNKVHYVNNCKIMLDLLDTMIDNSKRGKNEHNQV